MQHPSVCPFYGLLSSSLLQPKTGPIPTTVTLKQTADAISSYLMLSKDFRPKGNLSIQCVL